MVSICAAVRARSLRQFTHRGVRFPAGGRAEEAAAVWRVQQQAEGLHPDQVLAHVLQRLHQIQPGHPPPQVPRLRRRLRPGRRQADLLRLIAPSAASPAPAWLRPPSRRPRRHLAATWRRRPVVQLALKPRTRLAFMPGRTSQVTGRCLLALCLPANLLTYSSKPASVLSISRVSSQECAAVLGPSACAEPLYPPASVAFCGTGVSVDPPQLHVYHTPGIYCQASASHLFPRQPWPGVKFCASPRWTVDHSWPCVNTAYNSAPIEQWHIRHPQGIGTS